MSTLNYREAGATRQVLLPSGYRHLRHRTRIGQGLDVFEAAGAAVTTWRMHRQSGARVDARAPRVETGAHVTVSLGLGRLRFHAPCEVVWTTYGRDRIGFAYGTRAGHPECGEESFLVELAPDGTVWFSVTAFSRPGCWYTRLAGLLVPVLQRAYARHLGNTLRRMTDHRD